MKKLIVLILVLMLILALAVPASAVTPPLRIQELPKIPDISDNIRIDTKPAVDKWFVEHPIRIDWRQLKWQSLLR